MKKFGSHSEGSPVTAEERAELIRLRRELRIVKEERDILKKATAFFAKESK
jgi:transposase-like protein